MRRRDMRNARLPMNEETPANARVRMESRHRDSNRGPLHYEGTPRVSPGAVGTLQSQLPNSMRVGEARPADRRAPRTPPARVYVGMTGSAAFRLPRVSGAHVRT